MATAAAAPETVQIPNRLYFRIGDVCKLAGLKAHVLRYWETEFPMLAPKKSGTNQRLYRRKDVEVVLEVKRLLYEQRFTIEGARARLQQRRQAARQAPKVVAPPAAQATLFDARPDWTSQAKRMRQELAEILGMLE